MKNSSRTEKSLLRKFDYTCIVFDEHKINSVFEFFLSQIFKEIFDIQQKKISKLFVRCRQ